MKTVIASIKSVAKYICDNLCPHHYFLLGSFTSLVLVAIFIKIMLIAGIY